MNIFKTRTYIQYKTFVKSVLIPYKYRPNRYKNSFLTHTPLEVYKPNKSQPVDRVIYCFWTDDNPMSENRKKCLKSMTENCGVTIKLITPKELPSYIIDDYPLHPAYQYLSSVHKADYLRCYFMHHYGGGYCDIKLSSHSWSEAFNKLDKSNSIFIGYPEIGWYGAAYLNTKDTNLANDIKTYWRLLAGNGAYIFRPNTPFSQDWFSELNNRLDYFLEDLKKHPATDPFGKENNYPIPWAYINGNIFHALCLKYHKHISFSKKIMPSFENYR